jgi:hypothetical protein
MRLINDQHRTQAPRVARLQRPAERKQQLRFVLPVLDFKQRRDVLVELRDRQARVEDVGDQHHPVKPPHHPAQHGRLAGPNLAGDDDQPLAALDPEPQIGHRLGVRRRKVDEARVGRQRERQLLQSIEI